MKKILVFILMISTILFCGCFSNNKGTAIVDREAMVPRLIQSTNYSNNISVVKNVSPAVVGIYSKSGTTASIGTGVAIEKGGYVLTNSHVVTNKDVTLYLASGETKKATLSFRDASLDLAIVKCEIDLPYLEVAKAGDYSVGEDVLAIGTPLALQFQHTVTKGIISAKNRTIRVDNTSGATLQNLIQHDASINPGNSGGPLINLRGQVIGINTVKVEDAEGLGFAIPTDTISPIFTKLSSSNNEYRPAFLGFCGYDASIVKNNRNYKGVYVFDVKKGTSFDKIGIEKGDIITSFNGVSTPDMLSLRKALYSSNVGQKITIKYIKNNYENIAKITLCENCEK